MPMLESLSLENKVAIITGAGTGLGRAMSLALARAGAHIVVTGRRPHLIEATAREVQRLGRKALAIPTDVSQSSQVEAMVARTMAELGQVDILVNNAANMGEAMPGKPIWDIGDAEWHRGMDTILTGTFFCCRAVSRHMVERRQGKVINISTGYGLRGGRDNFMYCASKAGVILLTQSLALSWAQAGIKVNCIVPGQFLTMPPEAVEQRRQRETRKHLMPIGRFGEAHEIGPLAVYLAAAPEYVTGQVFIIDGGALASGYAPTGYVPVIPLK